MSQSNLSSYGENDGSQEEGGTTDAPTAGKRTPGRLPPAAELPHLLKAPGPVDGTATMWLLGVRYTDGAFLYLNPAPRSTTTDEFEHYAYRRPQVRSIEPYDPDSVLDDERTPRRKNRYEDDEHPRTLDEFQSFVDDEYWHYKTTAVSRLTDREVLSCEDYPTALEDLVDTRGVDGGQLLGTTTYNVAYYMTEEGDRFLRYLKLREDTVVQVDAPRRHQRRAYHRVPVDNDVWRGAFIAQVQTFPDQHGWSELTDVGEAFLTAYLDNQNFRDGCPILRTLLSSQN